VTTLRSAPEVRPGLTSWPFTPIEELDFYLENAAEPSVIQLETPVRGHLDHAILDAALADALAAEPAARRHLAATSQWCRRLRWEAGEPVNPAGLVAVAGWRTADQLAALRERLSAWRIPLHDRAVRLIVAAGPEHDIVIQQTHHAAFDGISSLALLAAIGAAYRERAGNLIGTGPQTAPRSPSSLPGTAGPASIHDAGKVPFALTRIATRLPGAVTRIATDTAWPARPGYGSVHRSVPVPRPARQGSGPFPTVNDLLVAALIRTVDRWNAAHDRRSGRIRISVPVNDRADGSRWAGPGNQSRLIRVTARPREHAGPARLLAHVATQTRAGKQRPPAGLDAASRLLATSWAPAVIKRWTARLSHGVAAPVCADTALLSNLGVIPEPPSFGGSGIEPLWFSGPARMPRGLGVGAVTAGGQLHLCVHYRYALLDQDAAADFTALYCRALGELAGRPA
jgi:NRPS condensation-like uncharacterized protein